MIQAQRTPLWITITLLGFGSVSHAQFWEKKELSKWSLNECASLTRADSGSPWVSTSEIGAKRYPVVPAGEPVPGEYMTYVATISSAWTIQRSYLCTDKLADKYRKPSAKDKTAIKQQEVENVMPDLVVFQVDYRGTRLWVRHSSDFWKTKRPDELNRLVTLVAGGKRIQPLRVEIKPEGELWDGLEVVFPRQIDGRPLLAPDMKEVILEVADPNEKVELRFEPRKMVVRGELVY